MYSAYSNIGYNGYGHYSPMQFPSYSPFQAQAYGVNVPQTPTTPATGATGATRPSAAQESPRDKDKEPATQYVYDRTTKQWNSTPVEVSLNPTPFTEGSMRYCYKVVHFDGEDKTDLIGKVYKERENRSTYFMEVEMQAQAATLADEFNSRNPPKPMTFLVPKLLEFHNRRDANGEKLLMSIEPVLQGEYKKHSNNYGYVSPEERNTPAAFSHFSYVFSGGKMLVCDIQGVGDTYTDPQIHTPELRYGLADMGIDGMQHFFRSHRCNALCAYLGLTDKGHAQGKCSGTVPQKKAELTTA